MKYRLLKDLPNWKAGTVFVQENDDGSIRWVAASGSNVKHRYLDEMLNAPVPFREWFEPIKEPEDKVEQDKLWDRFFKTYPEYAELIDKYGQKRSTPDEPEWEVGIDWGKDRVYVEVQYGTLTGDQMEALKEAIKALMYVIYEKGNIDLRKYPVTDLINKVEAARTLIQKGKESSNNE